MMTTLKRAAALALALCLLAMGMAACSPSDSDETQATTTAPVTTTTVTTTTTQNAVLEADNISVREGPGFDYAIIGGIFKGDALEIVGREGDWFKIRFADGYGYVNAQYVDVEGSPNASEMQASCPTTATTTTKANGTTKKGETTKAGQTTAAGATTTANAKDTTATGVETTATGKPAIPHEEANDAFN